MDVFLMVAAFGLAYAAFSWVYRSREYSGGHPVIFSLIGLGLAFFGLHEMFAILNPVAEVVDPVVKRIIG